MQVKDVVKKIEDYVQKNKEGLPILEECCFENSWDYDEFVTLFRSNTKVKRAVNMLLTKKKANLEFYGIYGPFNKNMAVYLLNMIDRELSNNALNSTLERLDALLLADEVAADRLSLSKQDEENLQIGGRKLEEN